MRLVKTSRVHLYVFRRGTLKRDGRRYHDHTGFEVRWRRSFGWTHLAFKTAPYKGKVRQKTTYEVELWHSDGNGRRCRSLKRYVRVLVGRGGRRNEESVPVPRPAHHDANWTDQLLRDAQRKRA